MVDALIDNILNIEDFDLILITASYYNRLAYIIKEKNLKVQRLIFDEVDNLNIPGCNEIDTNFTWFVTASYGNILYPRGYYIHDDIISKNIWYATGLKNSGYIKSLFIDLYINLPREFIKVLMIKNTESYVESSLLLPEIITDVIICKTPHTINILNGLVDKTIIDCLNAGDINQALFYISSNNKASEENIINLLIDKYNKSIDNINLRIAMTTQYIYDNPRDRDLELIALTTKLGEYNNKIKMIENRIHSNNICSICFDDIRNKSITKCCQNSFCMQCIMTWLAKKAQCPLCKNTLISTDIYTISDEASTSKVEEEIINPNEYSMYFDKFKNFEILIKKKKEENVKILIFSNFESIFQNVIQILSKNNIMFEYIKGNGNQIKCTIDRYKTSTLNVLLVNSTNYGAGLNLENTDDIIMFHKFDIMSERQLIGRAQRHGRVNSLKIHYLLYENENSNIFNNI
jgi:hypothetical protein